MTLSEGVKKISPAQKEFVEQAKRRMKNIKGMETDIKTRMRLCTSERCKQIEKWFDTVDSLKSQAAVEIEMAEMAAENEWAQMRQRVDEALGETEREFEKGYYILEQPE